MPPRKPVDSHNFWSFPIVMNPGPNFAEFSGSLREIEGKSGLAGIFSTPKRIFL
jgi:hypothetical protein